MGRRRGTGSDRLARPNASSSSSPRPPRPAPPRCPARSAARPPAPAPRRQAAATLPLGGEHHPLLTRELDRVAETRGTVPSPSGTTPKGTQELPRRPRTAAPTAASPGTCHDRVNRYRPRRYSSSSRCAATACSISRWTASAALARSGSTYGARPPRDTRIRLPSPVQAPVDRQQLVRSTKRPQQPRQCPARDRAEFLLSVDQEIHRVQRPPLRGAKVTSRRVPPPVQALQEIPGHRPLDGQDQDQLGLRDSRRHSTRRSACS